MDDDEHQSRGASDDIAAVTLLDDAWNQAYVEGDRSVLRDILSDDFVAVAHTGQLVTKSQLLQPPAESAIVVRFSEGWVRCWDATAITRGRIHVQTASMTFEHRFMRVYAKRAERWQAVGVQVVPVADRQPGQPPAPAVSTD
jgi:Domain of unknown function (DUF4440)